jgi:hypothetical protein
MVINPAAIFLVNVTTAKTIDPNNKILGKIYTAYALKYDLKLNEVTISGFVPGNLKPINKAIPITNTIMVTITMALKNFANK